METKLPVVEIFGPTIQGEGALIGVPTYFVRLGGCDYRCSWCDSMHAVDEMKWKNAPRLTAGEIVHGLNSLSKGPEWVTISGGNPAIHPDELCQPLVDRLMLSKFKIAVETQGTVYNKWLSWCDLITVSPKGPSSRNVTSKEVLSDFLASVILNRRAYSELVLKIVIDDSRDLEYADSIAEEFSEPPLYLQPMNPFYEMNFPEGGLRTLMLRLESLVRDAQEYEHLQKAIILPQLHVLMWQNQRMK